MSKKMKKILSLVVVIGCLLFALLYCLGNNVSLMAMSDFEFALLLLGVVVGFIFLNLLMVLLYFFSDGNEVAL